MKAAEKSARRTPTRFAMTINLRYAFTSATAKAENMLKLFTDRKLE
jgi:hypothetical protein